MFFWGDILTSQAGERQVLHHVPSQWHEDLPEDFKAIKASYMASGVIARVHGNKGKQKKVGLSLKQIQDVVQFIMNYAGVSVDL